MPTSYKVLFHTALVVPKKMDIVRFKVPSAPGDYPYLCTVFRLIMRVKMRVET